MRRGRGSVADLFGAVAPDISDGAMGTARPLAPRKGRAEREEAGYAASRIVSALSRTEWMVRSGRRLLADSFSWPDLIATKAMIA